ncbi:hypothetical protein ECG_08038 [Echinococcus granulosus]|nr:hypothetical protein ECG_08038 [Echinococcus granulosus]
MTHVNEENRGCKNVLRIGGSLVILLFSAIFFIAGTKLILTDVVPSANCSGDAAANGNVQLVKSCQDEQWGKRLMVASGYTMEGVALLLGMTFIAINVYVCINLTHGRLPRELQATPDILPEPHGPYSSAENSAVSGPPDYETACREPQPIPNDDMIAYQPPSTSPPPLATLTSNNTPP